MTNTLFIKTITIAFLLCFVLIGITSISAAPLPLTFTQGRIAISHDGNSYDKDDIFAVAMDYAIISAFGVQNKLVHYDACDNIESINTTTQQYRDQLASLNGHSQFPGLADNSIFFDDQTQLAAAIENFKAQAEASSANDPLYFICAGPMEVPWRMINAVTPSARKYINCISHSNWNDTKTGGAATHTWQSMINSFSGDGVIFTHISDQNGSLGANDNNFSWMSSMPSGTCIPPSSWAWVPTRNVKGDWDCSDAGMVWYLLTGDQNGNGAKLQERFLNPICGGTTQYTIIASADSNGSINPSGSVLVDSAASKTFMITANSGYQVDVVTVDGASQGAITSYTFINVTANHTITASFSAAPPDAVPWMEAFTYADGTTSHGAPTTWTATRSSGFFGVLGGRLAINNAGAQGVFSTSKIDISGGSVDLSVMVEGAGGLDPETSLSKDYFGIFFKVDGGAETLVYQTYGAQPATTISKTGIIGKTLEIVIKGYTTASDEFYYFKNLSVAYSNPTGIDEAKISLPLSTQLFQNYPNPFNPETTISYQLTEPSHARITIRNTIGQEINKLVDRDQAAGRYSVRWNGRDLSGNKVASGIYFYVLETNNSVFAKKLILLQ